MCVWDAVLVIVMDAIVSAAQLRLSVLQREREREYPWFGLKILLMFYSAAKENFLTYLIPTYRNILKGYCLMARAPSFWTTQLVGQSLSDEVLTASLGRFNSLMKYKLLCNINRSQKVDGLVSKGVCDWMS